MNKKRQPDEVGSKSKETSLPKTPLYNSVTDQGIPVLIKKKRHFGGLMCPPMAAVNSSTDKAEKRD